MADYNPNQFTPEVGRLQREARGQLTDAEKVEKLTKELEELRAEVKRLKGIKTYEIEVNLTVQYEVEAENENAARDWYELVGQTIHPKYRGTKIVNIKEKNG